MNVNQGNVKLNKEVCRDIAETTDKYFLTIRDTISVLANHVIGVATTKIYIRFIALLSLFSIMISFLSLYVQTAEFLRDYHQWTDIGNYLRMIGLIYLIALILLSSIYIIFTYFDEKEIKEYHGKLRRIGGVYLEMMKRYREWITACHKELCESRCMDDIEVLVLCSRLADLKLIDPSEFVWVFEDKKT